MSSMRRRKTKTQRVRDAGPSVVVVIIGATAHNPNTSPPTASRKGHFPDCVSGQFLRGCFVALWLLLGSSAVPEIGTSPPTTGAVFIPDRA